MPPVLILYLELLLLRVHRMLPKKGTIFFKIYAAQFGNSYLFNEEFIISAADPTYTTSNSGKVVLLLNCEPLLIGI